MNSAGSVQGEILRVRNLSIRAQLPNAIGPLAVQTAFTIANAILLEAGLSFLGLGIQPPTPSLRLMLQEARSYIRTDAWFGMCPGLTIVAMVLALNAVADDIARRADPRSATRRLDQSGVCGARGEMRMKITRVHCRLVDLPLPAPFHPAWARGRNQANILMVVVSVETDAGITGHTAAHAGREAAITVERFVAPYLIGEDPMRIERLTAILRDAEILGPPSYFMEIALWDIVGQQAGLPVYKLWGGAQDRVRAYCATAELRAPETRVEDVQRTLAEGYRGVKLRFHHDDVREDLKVVEAIRKVVGGRIEIMIDANQAGIEPGLSAHRIWGFQRTLAVARELEQLEVTWLEEPLTRYDYDGLARLRDKLDRIRIAGGEDNHGLHEFKLLIDRGCFDILQPDALLSEGVFQLRKVAAMAEAASLEIAPHTWGNGIGLLANLHLAASTANCGWLEFPHDPPSGFTAAARDQMLQETLSIDANGDVLVPDRPGFGFLLNEDRIAHHTVAEFG